MVITNGLDMEAGFACRVFYESSIMEPAEYDDHIPDTILTVTEEYLWQK